MVSKFLAKGFTVQLEPSGELFSVEVKDGTGTLVVDPKFLTPTNRRQHKACERLVEEALAAREAATAANKAAAAETTSAPTGESLTADEAPARKRQRL